MTNSRSPQISSHLSSSQESEWDDVLPVPKLRFSVASVLVFCLAVLCFANSYDGDFVLDDYVAVLYNKDLLPETPLSAIFAHDFWGNKLDYRSHKSYRPLTTMTYRWNYAWAGSMQPEGFHVVNIVLHGLVSVIFLAVFSVLMSGYQVDQESARPVFASPRAALLCAVLFAVHPIHTESVAGIVGRADLLCALTFLLSFLLYARACLPTSCLVSYRSQVLLPGVSSCLVSYRPDSFSLVSILASMCLCVVSTFCKEQGITVIGICSAFDIIVVCEVDPFHWLGLNKASRSKEDKLKKFNRPRWVNGLIQRHLILFITGVLVLNIRLRVMGSMPIFDVNFIPHAYVNGTIYRVLNYNYLYAINIWLLLNPWWLCCEWSMGCIPVITSLADPRILAVIALWTGFGAIVFHCCNGKVTHDRRILITSLAVLGVPFLPASNLLFRVGFVIAERILYLSCAGFCMLVVLGARHICYKFHSTARQMVTAGFACLIAVFVLRSIQRSNEWRVPLALYTSGDKVCPNNAKIQMGQAMYYDAINKTDAAIIKYRRAIELNSQDYASMLYLAVIFRREGEMLEAEQLLERSVAIRSDNVEALMDLGVVRAELKRNELAETSFLEAIREDNKCVKCYFNLGNFYRGTGRSTEAISAWRNATDLYPRYTPAWKNAILLLIDLKKYDKAIEVGIEALKALPKETNLMFHLANTYIMVDKFQESEDLFLAGLQIDPHSAKFHHNLGVLYHRWGNTDQAEVSFTRAVELEPTDATYLQNLHLIQAKIRNNA
ncbi:protein O-mannosyl-transferase TMTC4-like [Haliotis rubra]|uniref:protein O-mannosyl-transferase TMTC4-like n=1 Tax=Haliotis rubra TaxID=36100 RepID=UPI001EE5619B|nr:protein O-mannosyl-transferase TMTC4-like [Haliotis rubra]